MFGVVLVQRWHNGFLENFFPHWIIEIKASCCPHLFLGMGTRFPLPRKGFIIDTIIKDNRETFADHRGALSDKDKNTFSCLALKSQLQLLFCSENGGKRTCIYVVGRYSILENTKKRSLIFLVVFLLPRVPRLCGWEISP